MFSYNGLWKLLIDKGINKTQFRDMVGITNQSLSRLGKNQNVSLEIIGRICEALNCKVEDIIEYIGDLDSENREEKGVTIKSDRELRMSLKTISLFSGAGGLDLGLINSGYNIVFANDILKPAIENYRHNIGEISDQDITTIDEKKLPDADVVVGGFPCQPFSNAGNRLGTDDDRGNLYLDILRVIKEKILKLLSWRMFVDFFQ
ncbi:Type II restriction-modification system methylation subunit [Streptococcus sp. HSISB1]|nr:Type II restriction-modification system methylation subunit [Streptococcus sp. HSISB1]